MACSFVVLGVRYGRREGARTAPHVMGAERPGRGTGASVAVGRAVQAVAGFGIATSRARELTGDDCSARTAIDWPVRAVHERSVGQGFAGDGVGSAPGKEADGEDAARMAVQRGRAAEADVVFQMAGTVVA